MRGHAMMTNPAARLIESGPPCLLPCPLPTAQLSATPSPLSESLFSGGIRVIRVIRPLCSIFSLESFPTRRFPIVSSVPSPGLALVFPSPVLSYSQLYYTVLAACPVLGAIFCATDPQQRSASGILLSFVVVVVVYCLGQWTYAPFHQCDVM